MTSRLPQVCRQLMQVVQSFIDAKDKEEYVRLVTQNRDFLKTAIPCRSPAHTLALLQHSFADKVATALRQALIFYSQAVKSQMLRSYLSDASGQQATTLASSLAGAALTMLGVFRAWFKSIQAGDGKTYVPNWSVLQDLCHSACTTISLDLLSRAVFLQQKQQQQQGASPSPSAPPHRHHQQQRQQQGASPQQQQQQQQLVQEGLEQLRQVQEASNVFFLGLEIVCDYYSNWHHRHSNAAKSCCTAPDDKQHTALAADINSCTLFVSMVAQLLSTFAVMRARVDGSAATAAVRGALAAAAAAAAPVPEAAATSSGSQGGTTAAAQPPRTDDSSSFVRSTGACSSDMATNRTNSSTSANTPPVGCGDGGDGGDRDSSAVQQGAGVTTGTTHIGSIGRVADAAQRAALHQATFDDLSCLSSHLYAVEICLDVGVSCCVAADTLLQPTAQPAAVAAAAEAAVLAGSNQRPAPAICPVIRQALSRMADSITELPWLLSILVAATSAATATKVGQQDGLQPLPHCNAATMGSSSSSSSLLGTFAQQEQHQQQSSGEVADQRPAYQQLLEAAGLGAVCGSNIGDLGADDVSRLLHIATVVVAFRVKKLKRLCSGTSTGTASTTTSTSTSSSTSNTGASTSTTSSSSTTTSTSTSTNSMSATQIDKLFNESSRKVLPLLPAVVAELMWLHGGDAQVTAAGLQLIVQLLEACAALRRSLQQQQPDQQQQTDRHQQQQSDHKQQQPDQQQPPQPPQQQPSQPAPSECLHLLLPVLQAAGQELPGIREQLRPNTRSLLMLYLRDKLAPGIQHQCFSMFQVQPQAFCLTIEFALRSAKHVPASLQDHPQFSLSHTLAHWLHHICSTRPHMLSTSCILEQHQQPLLSLSVTCLKALQGFFEAVMAMPEEAAATAAPLGAVSREQPPQQPQQPQPQSPPQQPQPPKQQQQLSREAAAAGQPQQADPAEVAIKQQSLQQSCFKAALLGALRISGFAGLQAGDTALQRNTTVLRRDTTSTNSMGVGSDHTGSSSSGSLQGSTAPCAAATVGRMQATAVTGEDASAWASSRLRKQQAAETAGWARQLAWLHVAGWAMHTAGSVLAYTPRVPGLKSCEFDLVQQIVLLQQGLALLLSMPFEPGDQAGQQQWFQQCRDLQAAAAALVAGRQEQGSSGGGSGDGSGGSSCGAARNQQVVAAAPAAAAAVDGDAQPHPAEIAPAERARACMELQPAPAPAAVAAVAAAPQLVGISIDLEAVQQLAQELTACGAALCAAVPTKGCCNYPSCDNLSMSSEQQLVGGSGNTCSGCRVARYCCRQHQKAHWALHRQVCRVLAAQRQAVVPGG